MYITWGLPQVQLRRQLFKIIVITIIAAGRGQVDLHCSINSPTTSPSPSPFWQKQKNNPENCLVNSLQYWQGCQTLRLNHSVLGPTWIKWPALGQPAAHQRPSSCGSTATTKQQLAQETAAAITCLFRSAWDSQRGCDANDRTQSGETTRWTVRREKSW